MKRIWILLLIVSCTCFAGVYANGFEDLLNYKDWVLLEEYNKTPSITIPETNEAYYSEWDCHNSEELEFISVEVIYDEKDYRSPTAYAKRKGKLIEYSLDPISQDQAEEIMRKWEELIEGSLTTCFMSTFLQNSPDSELRIINRIKTQNGVWDYYEQK